MIFGMFQRGSDRNADRRGTGLGLAICDNILRAHKGTITAHHRDGGGTMIRIMLPHDSIPPNIALETDE